MPLEVHDAPSRTIWRVGYHPEPLAWSGWQHAENGRFPGRWDDPDGGFRTLYLGATLGGCLLEVLAHARRDSYMVNELAEIVEDPEDVESHPTIEPGEMDLEWLKPRCAAEATLSGRYCAVTTTQTVSQLYPHFIAAALRDGHEDFDVSLLKNAAPAGRKITQAVSAYLYLQDDMDGLTFASRHGDNEQLWCVYERPHEASRISPRLMQVGGSVTLTEDTPELLAAFDLLGLRWRQSS